MLHCNLHMNMKIITRLIKACIHEMMLEGEKKEEMYLYASEAF